MQVIGLDRDGEVLCYDPEEGIYNCGETLAQFGPDSLFDEERVMLALQVLIRIGQLTSAEETEESAKETFTPLPGRRS
jgi:hypothetical protein